MSRKALLIGVGMTRFEKPGSKGWDNPDLGREAGERQVDGAKIALQHNLGPGGAVVVTLYRKMQ